MNREEKIEKLKRLIRSDVMATNEDSMQLLNLMRELKIARDSSLIEDVQSLLQNEIDRVLKVNLSCQIALRNLSNWWRNLAEEEKNK